MAGLHDLRGSDIVLLLLAAPTEVEDARGRINGVTRLEKLLYLAERETRVMDSVSAERLRFKAYNYGPFSKDVYQAVEVLEEAGFVTEERAYDGQTIDSLEDLDVTGAVEGDEYVERRFAVTAKGEAVANLLSRLHPNVAKQLSEIKDKYAGRNLSSLIGYVYRTYPDSAVNSVIAHRYK